MQAWRAGWLAVWLLGPGVVTAEQKAEPARFAVLGFGGAAPEPLRAEITAQARGGAMDAFKGGRDWSLVPAEEIGPALMAMGEDEDVCERGKCAPQHLTMVGAHAGLTGQVMLVEPTIYVTMTLYDVRVNAQVDEVSVRADSPAELHAQVRRATAEMIRKGLKVGPPRATAGAPKGKVLGILLFLAERHPSEKAFRLTDERGNVAATAVVELLRSAGLQPSSDTAWVDKKSRVHLQEHGDLPLLDARNHARSNGHKYILSMRLSATDVSRGKSSGRQLLVSVETQVISAVELTFVQRTREEHVLQCPGGTLQSCAQAYRITVLEPVVEKLTDTLGR